MTKDEAYALVSKLLSAIIQARSIGIESTGARLNIKDRKELIEFLNTLDPLLYPLDESKEGYGLPQIAIRYSDTTKDFKPINLWNFMKSISQSDGAMLACVARGLISEENDLWSRPSWLKGDWDDDENI